MLNDILYNNHGANSVSLGNEITVKFIGTTATLL